MLLAVHVAISLLAILLGAALLSAMILRAPAGRLHGAFLLMTILTSATGFLLPADRILESHVVAVLSLLLLATAVLGRYTLKLAGRWRTVYAVCALASFYLNLLVLVTQMFLHIPGLHSLAPEGKEPPFVAAQVGLFLCYLPLAWLAKRGFDETR